jgi:two-component system nitrogen regulation response regulator NtrX
MNILVIDDEINIVNSIKMVLEYEEYNVHIALSGLDGIAAFKKINPDIILLDVKMPGIDGLSVLEELKRINPFSEAIMMSGHSGISEAVKASKLGAFDFLEKPISRDKLILTIRNASEKIKLIKENYNLKTIRNKKYRMIGNSAVMQNLIKSINKVAKTDSTVLITGESGTGKELIARNIHSLSKKSKNNFIQVNCAAIPEELIESELFGHEKGSFTGAYEKKTGKFENAHNGTIFLDEIGDLSIKAQAKVLRVLEEGEIQRVGSPDIKKVNVRIIAATNKNLQAEIECGKFREDLFFRLNVVPIYSLPLRERKEDIPILVEHFSDYFFTESNLKKKKFSEDAMEAFVEYKWKGNIRELRNIIERLLIMTESKTITSANLPDYIRRDKKETKNTDNQILFIQDKWKDFKRDSEKFYIEQKLEKFDYNIAKTAREIDLPRSNLYKKIEQFEIKLPE